MGEAGEHHSPPVISSVQVLMPLRGCVSITISSCQPTQTYSLRTSVLFKLSVAYISALPGHMRFAESQIFLQLQKQVIMALFINMFVQFHGQKPL